MFPLQLNFSPGMSLTSPSRSFCDKMFTNTLDIFSALFSSTSRLMNPVEQLSITKTAKKQTIGVAHYFASYLASRRRVPIQHYTSHCYVYGGLRSSLVYRLGTIALSCTYTPLSKPVNFGIVSHVMRSNKQ